MPKCSKCNNLVRRPQYLCQACKKAYRVKYRKLNLEQIRKHDVERKLAQRRQNPEKHKAERRRRKYGLTQEQFNDLLAAQGFMCKSCGDSAITPHVDHCHKTGRVRAILCTRCNWALGIMQEDPAKIRALAIYAKSLLSSAPLDSTRKKKK